MKVHKILTEYQKENKRKYQREYKKKNKEKIERIDAKFRKAHREKRNRFARERWKNDEEHRRQRREYWHGPGMAEKFKIYYKRRDVLKESKWNKMHISQKITTTLNKLLSELESIAPTGALDLKYLQQIKLRLDACNVLSHLWRKEYKLMENQGEIENAKLRSP